MTCPAPNHRSLRPYAIEKLEMRGRGSRVPAVRLSTAPFGKVRKRVVTFYVGGPAGDILPLRSHPLARVYLAHGWDVIFIAYSGTRGVGFDGATALHADPAGALRRDAEIVAAALGHLYASDVPVVVHGESFGAAAGLFLNKLLSARAGGFIGVVPYLLPRDPGEIIRPGEISGVNSAFQTRWERAVLGFKGPADRSRFRKALEEAVGHLPNTRSLLFIYGKSDTKAETTDLPASLRVHSRVVVVSGNHDVVLLNERTRSKIESYISSWNR